MAFSGYTEDVLEDVRSGVDIVDVVSGYVSLRQRGGDYWGLCPFHRESSPSFHVRPAEQFYHCFGCGAGGNVFGFIMRAENIGFLDAVRLLAERIHYALPAFTTSPEYEQRRRDREAFIEVNRLAAKFFYDKLNDRDGERVTRYLDERGVSIAARRSFGLGYAPYGDELYKNLNVVINDNIIEGDERLRLLGGAGLITEKDGVRRDRFRGRLMFPIFDPLDKLVAFGGRVLDDGQPKYLNSPDTQLFDKSRNIYGLNKARKTKEDYLIITEGYMDVIALHQNGFRAAVAALGTAFTPHHAALLAKYKKRVIVLFDSDEAGVKAAIRAIPILIAVGVDTRVLSLDGAKDPDEFLGKYGREKFSEALLGAAHHAAFRIAVSRKRFDFTKTVEKARFSQAAAEVIADLESPAEREAYITDTAEAAGITEAAVRGEVEKYIEVHRGRTSIREDFTTAAYAGKPMARDDLSATRADDEARRGLLAAMARRADIIPKISSVLAAEEFVEIVYIRLYRLLIEKSGATLAQIANAFETDEEQRVVAAVFESPIDGSYESHEIFYKALNDRIKIVKRAFIDRRIRTAGEDTDIMRLIADKKALESAKLFIAAEAHD